MILIVAPHLDDEVYGCTSFLVPGTTVLYCTTGHPAFPRGEVMSEAQQVVAHTGVEAVWGTARTNFVGEAPQANLIQEFELVLQRLHPATVLLPAPSYNQDHRAILDAALTALRPHDRLPFAKRVLLYEQPETFGTLRKPLPFHPTYFRGLDIGRKRELYDLYSTQARGHRSFGQIEALARVRGMQANMEYAEAFEVLRWVE